MTEGNDGPPTASVRNLFDEWGSGALAIVGAGMVAYAAIVFSHVDYVPLWDGNIYADCVLDAAEQLSLAALGCADHTTHGYILWLALAARFAPGGASGVVPILAVNVLLGLIALAALARLLAHVLPGRRWATERAVVCAAFAVQPLFVVSTLQPNVDFGILVFGLPCACALLERRVLAAAVLGSFVVFSKEPGIAAYGVLCLSVVLVLEIGSIATWRGGIRRLRPFVPLVIPLVLAGVYLGARTIDRVGVEALPSLVDTGGSNSVSAFAGRPIADPAAVSYLMGIFVLNFLWVPSSVLAADLGAAAAARLGWKARAPWPGPAAPALAIGYFVLGLTVILTRYKTFSNFRYLLVLYPFVMVLFAVALAKRVPSRPARLGILGGVVLLFALSNFRTIDPVSRAAFGTWPFGAHDLIDATRNTGECCGHGRDQLVYNLEFTKIATLEDQALARIRPTAETVLVLDPLANWFTIGRIDPVTFRRTLRRAGAIEPRVLDTRELLDAPVLPPVIFYVAFENVENEASLARLAEQYAVTEAFDFDDRGYTLRVYRMARRAG